MRHFTKGLTVASGVTLIFLTFRPANADEHMIPLAASGDWVALEHSDSITDPPDLCIAFTGVSGQSFGLRASTDDIEVRFSNDSWSLPSGVNGSLVLNVGSYSATLAISDNTNDMVMATITQDQLQSLVSAMDKADSMTVTAGKGPATAVSLNGSNTATTAFLTCAGINAPGEGGGGNPFQ